MNIVKTKSFDLAIYAKGDVDSPKLALILPGRLDTKDYIHMRDLVDFLGAKGYYALSFDPPGTWDSPGGTVLYSTSNYIKSVNELISFYGSKPTVLLGHSRGAAVAILAGSLNPSVTSIVAVAASYGQPTPPSQDIIQSGFLLEQRDLPPGGHRTEEKKQFHLPAEYFNDAVQYSAAETLRRCKKPKLIFYCDDDEFTKPERVKEVYEEVPEPKMLHELRSTHDYRLYPEAMEEVRRVVSEFFGEFNT
jgi:pimeloyl-ACP methyl ester carboxylesterase